MLENKKEITNKIITQEEVNIRLLDIAEKLKRIPNISFDYIEYFSALIYIVTYDVEENSIKDLQFSMEDRIFLINQIDYKIENIRKKENSKKLFINIKFEEIIIDTDNFLILKQVIIQLLELILKLKELETNGKKMIAEAFEYVIMRAAKNNELPLKNGEFYTSKGLIKSMVNLLDIKDKMAVYNPACGTGNFLTASAKVANIYAFGEESSIYNYNICMTNLWLHEIYNKRIKEDEMEQFQKADIAIANPPFSSENQEILKTNINGNFINYYDILTTTNTYIKYLVLMLENTNERGRISIILPHGFLFKKDRASRIIREKLIKENYIDAIIGLPEKLFYDTKIPVVILLIDKARKRDEILFIDASREYTKKRKNNILTVENQEKITNTYKEYKVIPNYSNIVTTEEIAKNNYDLSIEKYVEIQDKIEIIDKEMTKKYLYNLEKEKEEVETKIRDLIKNIDLI